MLRIDGEVETPRMWTFDELAAMDPDAQVGDVSRIDPKRAGGAIKLAALLAQVRVKPTVRWITLHASADNFHASIPLAAVVERALVIYQLAGEPLPLKSGGPVRFFIPDHAACHTAEIDECANVKFIDRIELSNERGFDNRPTEDEAHAALHRNQPGHER